MACRILVSAPVPVPFLWTLDLDLGLGFGTGLGLDNMIYLNYLMNCKMNMMKSWRYYNLKMN